MANEFSGKAIPPWYTQPEFLKYQKRHIHITKFYDEWFDIQDQKSQNVSTTLNETLKQKKRAEFRENWTEFNSLSIFQQGNDPTIGLVGGGGGTVQYLTSFGEKFLNYIENISQ